MDAQDAMKTHVCRAYGCTEEVRSDRGRYSRCDYHRRIFEEQARAAADNAAAGASDAATEVDEPTLLPVARPTPAVPLRTNGKGHVANLRALMDLAKKADLKAERARKLAEKALAAKAEADAARTEYVRALRQAHGASEAA